MKTKMLAVEKSLRTLGDEELEAVAGGYVFAIGSPVNISLPQINTQVGLQTASGNFVVGGSLSQSMTQAAANVANVSL